jgi:hypothetical protein
MSELVHQLNDTLPEIQEEISAQPAVQENQAGKTPVYGAYERPVQKEKPMKKPLIAILGMVLVVVAAGVGTGYVFARKFPPAQKTVQTAETSGTSDTAQLQVGQKYGSTDTDTFKDMTEGVLQKGGINGEGSHKILKEGGESQTVYITSSMLNLDQFDGVRVRVRGETFHGQRAGWLMDVGQVEVLELNAALPAWAAPKVEGGGGNE